MTPTLRQSLASLKRPIAEAVKETKHFYGDFRLAERTEKQSGEMEYRYDPEKQERVAVRCGEVGGV